MLSTSFSTRRLLKAIMFYLQGRIYLLHISAVMICTFQVLSRLKAMGCDYISPKILKFCAASLSGPVTSLINMCLESCTFLEEWKTHMITPILKSGDLSSIRNYRPISLLCILSKVMEKLVYDKIIDFIRPQPSMVSYKRDQVRHNF